MQQLTKSFLLINFYNLNYYLKVLKILPFTNSICLSSFIFQSIKIVKKTIIK